MATLLTRAGHTVAPDSVRESELLLLTASGAELRADVAALESTIRRGQIVVHTDPAQGVQVLDPLEVHGAIPVAIAQVVGMFFVTALDELGQTVGQLLATDMKGASVPVEEGDRPLLARVERDVAQVRAGIADARRIITDITGSEEIAAEVITAAVEGT
ncbi:MAG: hypothetical protein SPI77_07935 [Corynebacterium sp.]|nr:hypothetical protein [Corynebacterium sp.]